MTRDWAEYSDPRVGEVLSYRDTKGIRENPGLYHFPFKNKVKVIYKGNQLCTYFYPAAEGVEKRGRIIYFHGYSEVGGSYAFFFKKYTDEGYDVHVMD